MKLSEAILLGSTLSPQAIGVYESADGSRCALGAALAAVGKQCHAELEATYALDALWPHLNFCYWGHGTLGFPCCPDPNCGGIALELAGAIVHLNDVHFWTREQIAAWAARFEPPEVIELREERTEICGQGPRIAPLEAPLRSI